MLEISYSGSLNYFEPLKGKNAIIHFIKELIWTFQNENIDASTRSGYFLIQAIRVLKEENSINPHQLKISLWGDIHEENIKQIKDNKVEEYFNIGNYIPKEESLKKLMKSDLLFLPLEKSKIPYHRTLYIPGKLFEYMITGKPILALCEASDCKSILLSSGLGICIEPDNVRGLADVILELIRHPEKLGQYKPNQIFIDGFSFRKKTMELTNVFDQLLNKGADK